MLYTKNQINKILDNYENLMDLVSIYVSEKYPKERRGEVRIKWNVIEEYVNTSCHCHPEYEWSQRGPIEDFYEWVNTHNFATKHYPKY